MALHSSLVVGLLGGSLMACGTSSPSQTPLHATPPQASSPTTTASASPAELKVELTEEVLRAKPSLRAQWPTIEAVTADLGEPTSRGMASHAQLQFDVHAVAGGHVCSAVEVVSTPTDGTVIHEIEAFDGECSPAVTVTKSDLEGLPERVADMPFDEAMVEIMGPMSQQPWSGQGPFAAWRYTGSDGGCRLLLVTPRIDTNVGLAVYGLPCP